MTYSFNLVDRNWIPCIHPNGQMEEFSLRRVLAQAHQLRSIQGDSPLETAAIYRLLLAILHSAFRGPRSKSAWAGLWRSGDGSFDQPPIQDYLDHWKHCFDLFDSSRPFYQAADHRARPKSVITLVMDMVSGNNAVLFDHHTEDSGVSLSSASSARTLITAQTFGLAGLWLPGITFTDAPWSRGTIFLVEGESLFQTLALNLMSYPDENRNCLASGSADQPVWENDDPYQPARQIPQGYLDYLTWPSRRVLLAPQGDENDPLVRAMTLAPGLRLDASILDPMKLYRKGVKEGLICSRFTEDRALWRDSASLFALRSPRGNRPPRVFDWLNDLASDGFIPQKQTYRFMALGMATDQAKVDFFQEEHLPLPLAYLEDETSVEQLSDAIQKAEDTRYALKRAAGWMALLVISPGADGKKWPEIDKISKSEAEALAVHWNIERQYWQQLEFPFFDLLEKLPDHPEALVAWYETLHSTAWDVFDQATRQVGLDAQALKASTRARGFLGYSLNELFPVLDKEAIE